jgi:hypothetical protein
MKEFAKVAEEIYPADPKPVTVDTKLFVSALAYAVEKEEKL